MDRLDQWTRGPSAFPLGRGDGRYVYYDNESTETPGYRRVKVGQTRSEFLIDLKDLHRYSGSGVWSGHLR